MLREALGIDVMTQLKDTVERALGKGSAGTPQVDIAPLITTQTRVHMTVEAFRGVGQGEQEDEGLDDVTEELVDETPRMFMDQAAEMRDRREALRKAAYEAVEHGLPSECFDRLMHVGRRPV